MLPPLVFERHIPVNEAGIAPVDCLYQALQLDEDPAVGLAKAHIKRAMLSGAVWLTRGAHSRRLRRVKTALKLGDELHLYYNSSLLETPPVAATLVADEGDYSVWYKPAGMFSQGTKWGDAHSIVRWAEQHMEPQRIAKLVHRLDRHTSGLMLLAHSKTAAAALSQLFANHGIHKQYEAIAVGCLGQPGDTQRVELPVAGKAAASVIKVLASTPAYSLLSVSIETGRRHQIRCHLSERGFPIIGDRLYGQDHAAGLQLAAVSLEFDCPLSTEPRCYALAQNLRPRLADFVER